ncbi:MAG: BamA/TamA family outer membrane protein [Gemmatimonadetes bacterium]|nr:BamA/TamA family outer membrane protein [Gemmatimonadota bacterium]
MVRPPEALRHRAVGAASLRALLSFTVMLIAGGTADVSGQLRRLEVKSVRFEGNETFPDDSLARAIVTQETDCRSFVLIPFCGLGFEFSLLRGELRNRELPRDQARLIIWYQRRGFFEVQVDAPTVARGLTTADVTFQIVEGTPVIAGSILFIGAEEFEEAGLLDDLPLRQGDRYSTVARDATRDTIERRLQNRGFAHARAFWSVFRPSEAPHDAQVTFEIVPGPPTTYGAINVTGIEDLSIGTVRRTLQFRSGDSYRRDEIDEALARLYGLDIVRSATVAPDLGEGADSVVAINVVVQEGDAYRVRAGLGWSSAECLNVESRWTSRNFLGGGRVLQIRGRVGNLLAPQFRDVVCTQSGKDEFAKLTWLAAVDLVQPWIFSTRNSLTASVFAERQSLPDVFIRRAIGFQLALARSVSPRTVLTVFFRPELSELDADDVLFCTGFLVCSPRDIEALESANLLSPVGVNLTRDRSDDLLNPRAGYRVVLDVEHAAPWTASDFRYDRIVIEATRYTPLWGGSIFATRLRGGWVGSGGFEDLVSARRRDQIVHPQKRFYVGGANSVRGFAQSRLGPRVLVTEPETLLSQENGAGCLATEVADWSCDANAAEDEQFSEQPTGGTRVLEANAEVRFPLGPLFEGVIFADVGQAWGNNESILLQDLEFTPGVGVRFASPVGPIRIDLAYRFRRGEELLVVTPQIRPFVAGDVDSDGIMVDGSPIPWIRTDDLVFLIPRVLFGTSDARLQLHVSIGQAF